MKEQLLKGLNKEQLAKASQCKTAQELLDLAKEEGVRLTDEQLEAVNGGCAGIPQVIHEKCPSCGADCEGFYNQNSGTGDFYAFQCYTCGTQWRKKS